MRRSQLYNACTINSLLEFSRDKDVLYAPRTINIASMHVVATCPVAALRTKVVMHRVEDA